MTPGEQALIAYLYGEMNEAERSAFEEQLAGSPSLKAELEALKATRSLMSEWKDEAPYKVVTPLSKEKKRIPYSWFAAGMAASFLLVALVTLLAGAQISYSRQYGLSLVLGGFGNRYVDQQLFKASLDSVKAVQPLEKEKTTLPANGPVKDEPVRAVHELTQAEMQQVMNIVNEQNRRNMRVIMTGLEQTQEKQLDLTLRAFAGYLEQQRKTDIQTIGSELQKIKRTSDDKFYETDMALNKLFQTVQYPNR